MIASESPRTKLQPPALQVPCHALHATLIERAGVRAPGLPHASRSALRGFSRVSSARHVLLILPPHRGAPAALAITDADARGRELGRSFCPMRALPHASVDVDRAFAASAVPSSYVKPEPPSKAKETTLGEVRFFSQGLRRAVGERLA